MKMFGRSAAAAALLREEWRASWETGGVARRLAPSAGGRIAVLGLALASAHRTRSTRDAGVLIHRRDRNSGNLKNKLGVSHAH
jgi:hypothetical protein